MTTNFSATEPGMACPCCGEAGIKQEVLEALQTVRNIFGFAIEISSGYRCKLHNESEKVGGSSTSSHVLGWAVDIKIPNTQYAFKLMQAVLTSGVFMRIGYGLKKGKTVFHLDIDPNKVSPVLWGY